MKWFSDIRKAYPKAPLSNDGFAAYYSDGGDEEYLYFKMLPWHTVRYIARALQQMRVFPHFRLERHEEDYRNGYVGEKFCLRMLERDEALMPLADVKRITSEMVEAMGFELHWIPVSRILNMKIDNLKRKKK